MSQDAGPAHVAVVSFLAARAAPSGGFFISLAGGVALARAAERGGARRGFGASIAAMLETVAVIGPVRFGIPFTQALSAPLLGRLDARGAPLAVQLLACAAVRILHNAATTAFFIWVIAGGLDAYAGTYDAIARRLGLEVGTAEALALTAVGLIVWAAFASVVQVLVYRRGLRRWDELAADAAVAANPAAAPAAAVVPAGAVPTPVDRGRFDPRAVALAAVVATVLLLSSTAWPLLGAVALWLALAWLLCRPDPAPLATGAAFAAVLAGGALIFALGGGLGIDTALRRALRAALLVLVATWLRAAARSWGVREVARRVLRRLRWLPAVPEAAAVLDAIASEGRLVAAGRALLERLRGVPASPVPLVDAVLGWAVAQAHGFRPVPAGPAPPLALRAVDLALVALAATPAATLLA